MEDKTLRILTLDGGGAKGFYTIGILREIEAIIGSKVSNHFDLIYGTSTGAIIATLLAQGRTVEDCRRLYASKVADVLGKKFASARTKALELLAYEVFGDDTFTDLETDLGIVSTKWIGAEPMIFKSDIKQAHGRRATFIPGFGVKLRDAVVASCSAYPLFEKKTVETAHGEELLLLDGGYCANNPSLYALSDALNALDVPRSNIRLLTLGCGNYPLPSKGFFNPGRYIDKLLTVRLLQKTMEINTKSMERVRQVLFSDIRTVRIDETYTGLDIQVDLLTTDPKKLNLLLQKGRDSGGAHEAEIKELLEV